MNCCNSENSNSTTEFDEDPLESYLCKKFTADREEQHFPYRASSDGDLIVNSDARSSNYSSLCCAQKESSSDLKQSLNMDLNSSDLNTEYNYDNLQLENNEDINQSVFYLNSNNTTTNKPHQESSNQVIFTIGNLADSDENINDPNRSSSSSQYFSMLNNTSSIQTPQQIITSSMQKASSNNDSSCGSGSGRKLNERRRSNGRIITSYRMKSKKSLNGAANFKELNSRKLKVACPFCKAQVVNMSDHFCKKHNDLNREERKRAMNIIRKSLATRNSNDDDYFNRNNNDNGDVDDDDMGSLNCSRRPVDSSKKISSNHESSNKKSVKCIICKDERYYRNISDHFIKVHHLSSDQRKTLLKQLKPFSTSKNKSSNDLNDRSQESFASRSIRSSRGKNEIVGNEEREEPKTMNNQLAPSTSMPSSLNCMIRYNPVSSFSSSSSSSSASCLAEMKQRRMKSSSLEHKIKRSKNVKKIQLSKRSVLRSDFMDQCDNYHNDDGDELNENHLNHEVSSSQNYLLNLNDQSLIIGNQLNGFNYDLSSAVNSELTQQYLNDQNVYQNSQFQASSSSKSMDTIESGSIGTNLFDKLNKFEERLSNTMLNWRVFTQDVYRKTETYTSELKACYEEFRLLKSMIFENKLNSNCLDCSMMPDMVPNTFYSNSNNNNQLS